ncbi:hypothetical protein Goshw_007047 [Gossypium schwendimanii]|uniref:DUF7745 domain-containing protein n=1 Tax=Gossypium schwendimanii TaxID=34291 RepID=A0A7J9NFW3_GOSSC|nr:hypothetical protein [Gossypium schwendimanii]
MSEQWVTARIKKKGKNKCIPWKSLRGQILAHLDTKKKVDVFTLSIYRLVIFPKALGHIDKAVTNLFDQLDRRVTPVLAILAEMFRSLSAYWRMGEGRFIGCAQLLLVWFHSHFWKVDKEKDGWRSFKISKMKMLNGKLLGWCLMRFCIDVGTSTGSLYLEFGELWDIPLYSGNNYKGKIREISNTWKQIHWMKRFIVGATITSEYHGWLSKRINDNILESSHKNSQSIEEYLRVIPSKLEIIKQDFERRNTELEKRIEQMEEEKMNLRLDADVQKLEAERLRKGKAKAEKDLDSLKTDYKKLRLSMKTVELGKTSEQWREEIQEEKNKADR